MINSSSKGQVFFGNEIRSLAKCHLICILLFEKPDEGFFLKTKRICWKFSFTTGKKPTNQIPLILKTIMKHYNLNSGVVSLAKYENDTVILSEYQFVLYILRVNDQYHKIIAMAFFFTPKAWLDSEEENTCYFHNHMIIIK